MQKAFLKAPTILRELKQAGVRLPRFELFEDASGRLILGKASQITDEQLNLAADLVHSLRISWCMECMTDPEHAGADHDVAIQFCCGLVDG